MRKRLPMAAAVLCAVALTPAVATGDGGRPHDPVSTDRSSTAWLGPFSARETTSRRQVAPGVELTRFGLVDRRGPNKCLLLTIDLRHRGVSMDYAAQPHVAQVAPIVKTLRAEPHAVAGVNGDFYDIGDTGAPLGLGKDRRDGLLHGPLSGWNSAFYLDAKGRPHIGTLAVHTVVGRHPHLRITNLNSPYIADDGIGVYTAAWGPAPGRTVTADSARGVRVVHVLHGRVASTSTSFDAGRPILGALLIGRGAGATALSRLHVGDRAPLRSSLDQHPAMAISGSMFLVHDGVVSVIDDKITAPRTAIGIDDDSGQVLILEVDGRQKVSRGMTYLELANLMVDLGADSALNLDGGGSSNLVARNTANVLAVMNTPSDGFQRYVADGVAVTYTKPR